MSLRAACAARRSTLRAPALRVRCTSSSGEATAVDAAAAPLLSWLHASGAQTDGVRVRSEGGSGLGLVAARDCAPGALLATLPPSCLLSYDPQALAPSLRALVEAVPAQLWSARLGLVLLEERSRGDLSPFSHYVSLLPSRFEGIPTFFSAQGVAAIQYPPVSAQVNKRARFLAAFAREQLAQHNALPGAPPFCGARVDANAMGWAVAAVSSRAFRLRGPSAPASMLPLLDLANHSFAPNVEVKATSDGGVALRALAHFPIDTPLLLSYGALSNDFLLLDYGFIVAANPHDRCALRFSPVLLDLAREVAGLGGAPFGGPGEAATDDPDGFSLFPWQRALLRELRLLDGPNATLEVTLGGADGLDGRLLAALRVLYTQDAAALRAIPRDKQAQYLQQRDGMLSVVTERCALATAASMAAITLSQWPSTLKEDQELLESPTVLTPDVRLAVSFRADKKRALSEAIASLKDRIAALSAPNAAAAAPDKPRAKGFGKRE